MGTNELSAPGLRAIGPHLALVKPPKLVLAMPHTRILIVDDDPQAYQALQVLLRDEGYSVELAESAAEAFEMVGKNSPDLVLTDLQMPEMDGIGLCRGLQAHRPELPVIVLTGFADTTTAVRALQAGAEDYLTKPVDFDELLVSVQRAIERRAASVERQHLRERTEELYRQALAAVNAHEEVLSVVAHDLRNPLGVILLWAQQLLADEPNALGQRAKSGLSTISRNAMRMQRLIADLLDESRLRSGRWSLEYGDHLLSQLLADVSELRPLAQQKRVRIDVVPPARDRLVTCDRARVSQVLGNLLANAIKFSPVGGTVTVTADDEGGVTRFGVRDEGPGIAPEALPRIFDRFWQGKGGSHAGVGLGLYIVKGIVESHGGHVSAESQLGGGSTFYVSLPDARTGRTAPLDAVELSAPARA